MRIQKLEIPESLLEDKRLRSCRDEKNILRFSSACTPGGKARLLKVFPDKDKGPVRRAGEGALNLIYPRRCPVCEGILLREESCVCAKCVKDLPWVSEPFCRKCGRPMEDMQAEYCVNCSEKLHFYNEGRSAFIYEKGMRRSVDRMKFHNHREYIPFYARSLYLVSKQILTIWKPQYMISVPMHPKKRAERGFDQARLIALELAALCGIPVLDNLLLRTRYTAESKKLGLSSRKKNLRGAFDLRNGIRPAGCRLLLVDDIYTTGTTMDGCAMTLKKHGAGEVYFLTVCTGRGDS